MKVIIAGGRDFDNYDFMCYHINKLIESGLEIEEIVSGCARGADTLGLVFATRNNIPVKRFPANWDAYSRRAGILRNEDMGDYADYLIAFWDGQSRGTKHMIEYMKKIGKHGVVINYEK